MIVLSDKNNVNWGVFVYHNGSERVIYTRVTEYDGIAPREARINSFDGAFRLLIDPKGTLYTYPINRKGLYV